jgi:hypothetical protein
VELDCPLFNTAKTLSPRQCELRGFNHNTTTRSSGNPVHAQRQRFGECTGTQAIQRVTACKKCKRYILNAPAKTAVSDAPASAPTASRGTCCQQLSCRGAHHLVKEWGRNHTFHAMTSYAGVRCEYTVMDLDVMQPLMIAVMVSKYWGPTPRQLTVSFMESTPTDLRTRILAHMNEWAGSGCVNFVWTQGVGQVRNSRSGGGYWSYIGTDILHIPQDRQTMNLQDFTMNTPKSEYKRVIRHETGHTLGFPHEHMRQELIARTEPAKAYDYFWRTQGWNRDVVDAQVLTPLDQKSIVGTPA